jgi:hypothetical protein
MDEQSVLARLHSARVRAHDLIALTPSDSAELRHRLAQEFFFHLGGTVEFMAQLAAERRGVGMPDEITMATVADRLVGDPLEAPLRALYINPRRQPFPADPYDDCGYLWRFYNYRHQVTHRGANPFHFNMYIADAGLSTATATPPQSPTTHFLLDPLDSSRGASRETISDDMGNMIDLIERLVATAMNAL